MNGADVGVGGQIITGRCVGLREQVMGPGIQLCPQTASAIGEVLQMW